MEQMVAAGKVKAIGVSNFTQAQLEHLQSEASIVPAVNQIELHPYCSQQSLVQYCEDASIAVMGYSPLGSSAEHAPPGAEHTLLNNPIVAEIAEKVGKTAAQVLIRWGIQRYSTALVTIPKSSNPTRIAQNCDVYDWVLPEEAMSQLDELNCDFRYFMSYLKRPDNDIRWHDGVIEKGDASDYVSGNAVN